MCTRAIDRSLTRRRDATTTATVVLVDDGRTDKSATTQPGPSDAATMPVEWSYSSTLGAVWPALFVLSLSIIASVSEV